MKSLALRISTTGAQHEAHDAIDKCRALLSERGEVSGHRIASEVLQAYESLSQKAVVSFFDALAQDFAPDYIGVMRAAEAYRTGPSASALLALQTAIEPPRQELFRRLNLAPEGTPVLVRMRRRILEGLSAHPEWAAIDADLAHLFRSWFNRGFLVLQRIDWRTSAIVLERLIQYEAVHQIHGWDDLHRRLEADRRCYAFFSPALPDDPLIFIEVALTKGMPAKVQPLLDPAAPVIAPRKSDCATFYSITNCQEGLRGISFGNFLIKQVAEDLGGEFRQLKLFATLSPIPGFMRWLSGLAGSDAQMTAQLRELIELRRSAKSIEPPALELKSELSHFCAHYLMKAKHAREPLDPVARFHLANGARLERINWLADTSTKGLTNSCGLMVNYLYSLGDVERNHEAFARNHEVVASREVRRLTKKRVISSRRDAP